MRRQFERRLPYKMRPSSTIIAAMDLNRLIGDGDELPWKLPADLRHFRRHTVGKSILMGRKTYESIGKPLPKRRNIVLSRRIDYRPVGVDVFHRFEDVLNDLSDEDELMIIGGSHVYRDALLYADRMLLTVIHGQFSGDVFFPAFKGEDWSIVDRQDHDAADGASWPYSFLDLRRTASGTPLPIGFPQGL